MRLLLFAATGLLTAVAAGALVETASAQDRVRRSIDGPLTREAVTRSLILVTDNVGDPGAPTEVSLMRPIEFEFDSAGLTVRAQRELDIIAEGLNDPQLAAEQLTVEGHADATGDANYNRRLSQRRAEAVVAYLVRRGVAGHRLYAAGFGEDRLLSEYAPTDGRQRRVEIVRTF